MNRENFDTNISQAIDINQDLLSELALDQSLFDSIFTAVSENDRDAETNLTDTDDEEERIFSSSVQKIELTPEELRLRRQKDNNVTIISDRQTSSIEQLTTVNNPNPSLDGVFGDDDRTVVTDTTSDPWSKVGFVTTRYGNNWYGSSGVMIGPHHFLTSAHSIFDSSEIDDAGNGGFADEIKIYLGQNGQEKYYGEVGVNYFHTVKGYTEDNDGDGIIADADPDENSWDYDWAVLNLDRNIGNHTGWMGWQWNDDLSWYNGLNVNITGYPSKTIDSNGVIQNNWSGDFAGTGHSAQMYTISGQLNSANTYHMQYNLDVSGGNSGGPVWRSDGNNEYVLGVVTGVVGDPPHSNKAVRLQEYITDFIDDWKENDTTPTDRPDFVDYDEWFSTDYAYFINNETNFSSEFNNSLAITTGDSFTVRSLVRNNGTAADDGLDSVSTSIDVSFYASTNDIISNQDYYLGDVTLSAINPFEWEDAILTANLPDITAGNYYIGWIIDSNQALSEFDESNNTGLLESFVITVQDSNSSDDDEFIVTEAEFLQNPSLYMKDIRDFDGNNLGASGSWQQIGSIDVQGDGDIEHIFVNPIIGRWATVGVYQDPLTGQSQVNFANYSWGGDTRVVGIYEDPLIALGIVEKDSDFDSQRRFQNDLYLDNLILIPDSAHDYDGDLLNEMYFKVKDGTAVLHAYMHADGNIQYANYQSESDLEQFMNDHGIDSSVWDDWF